MRLKNLKHICSLLKHTDIGEVADLPKRTGATLEIFLTGEKDIFNHTEVDVNSFCTVVAGKL
jgi:hypothetical protein